MRFYSGGKREKKKEVGRGKGSDNLTKKKQKNLLRGKRRNSKKGRRERTL